MEGTQPPPQVQCLLLGVLQCLPLQPLHPLQRHSSSNSLECHCPMEGAQSLVRLSEAISSRLNSNLYVCRGVCRGLGAQQGLKVPKSDCNC